VTLPATIERAPEGLDGLRVVALFKFGKALLLMATAYGESRLLNPQVAARLTQWSETLNDHFAQRLTQQALEWVSNLSATTIDGFLLITMAYTALVLLEGFGLWRRRRWGEWLTAIATSLFIPFELWKLIFRPGHRPALLALVMLVNISIVLYLAWHLRRGRRGAVR
jgi:uncharacterized membrane protein (DUF2068 family)